MSFQGTGRLTVAGVKRLLEQRKPGRYSDGGGLHVYIDRDGHCRWVWRWTIRGKRRDLGIGPAWDVGLAEARKRAAKYREQVRDGDDPIAERRRAKMAVEAPTFAEAARTVHAALVPSLRNEKYARQWFETLEDYAFPTIGSKQVHTITSGDVLKLLGPIWIEKPTTARLVMNRIGAVMEWAVVSGHCPTNVAQHVHRGLPKQPKANEHHKALDYGDLPGFVAKLREHGSEHARLPLEFLVLTAGRLGEVTGAVWDEIDMDKAVWVIPGSRMKAGVEHRVPLSARALAILARAKELSCGSDYIFPASRGGGRVSSSAILVLVKQTSGNGATIHGFRSAFRDWAGERTNTPREVCEQSLAHHIGNQAEQAYRRSDLFEKRRRLMDKWSAYVEGGGEVVPIRKVSA